jgi:hypothetical protein
MTFMETSLWRAGFGGQYSENEAAIQLRNALLDMRRLTEFLVAEITADLRQYTVHDITHLEALWGVASGVRGSCNRVQSVLNTQIELGNSQSLPGKRQMVRHEPLSKMAI